MPNGFQGNTLKLSVFVSPRLYNNADTQLGQFPDFVSWAKRVSEVSFEVEFKAGPKLKANVVSEPPNNDLWTTIFKPTTFVRTYKFPDHHKRVIRTYPVADVMGYLKDLYTRAGDQSPTTLPKLEQKSTELGFNLNELFNELGGIREKRSDYEKRFDSSLNRQQIKAFDPNQTEGLAREQFAFMQVDFFYDRKRNKNLKDEQTHPKPVPKRIAKPKLDFHQMLSGLGDYPGVERKIGIVIDLEVPVATAAQLATLMATHSIRVRPQWTSPASAFNNDFAPWTKLLAGKFIAEPNPNSDLKGGMLSLADVNSRFLPNSKPNYDLLQLDADGASMKTLDFASNMRRFLSAPHAYSAPDDGGLPSFRTCGLSLVKRGRAFQLASDLQQTLPNNQAVENSPSSVDMNLPVLLYADDLVRGYRVDILDQSMGALAGWRSLCKRVGTYSFPNSTQPALKISDEGYVKGASATSTVNGASDSDLYLHETMFQWEGWSLSATRPGKTIIAESYDNNGNALKQQNEKVEYSPNSAKGIDGVNIETSFGAQPGTLPRLRFGHTYRMRVRAADLAGNSQPAESKDASQASEQHTFARFDPVVPPAILLRDRVSEGESVEHMVIRSNYNQSAADYVARALAAINNPDFHYTEVNERHIAPPKTSQQMAELHGKFDEFIGYDAATDTKKDYERGYKLGLKETGTFLDKQVYDPKTDATQPVVGIELVTPKSVPADPAPPILPLDPPGRPLAAGQYVIHKEENLMLPYLPDPFSKGVAFVGLPRVTSPGSLPSDPGAVKVQLPSLNPNQPNQKLNVLKVQFDGAWPDATPFRIRIVEGSGDPVWKNHVLTVFLQKAEVARVRYSSYLNKDDLAQMGIWSWLTKKGQLEPYAAAGQHWMFTPFRRLELVHAVQQPLKEPKFYKMETKKLNLGDTYVDFQGNIDLSVKSTSKIEVHGKWKEWIDSLSEPGPRQLSLEGNAFEGKIEEKAEDICNVDGPGFPKSQHEFHDTKYRAVDYQIIATTRFREYFPPEITKDPENITRRSVPQTFKVLNTARPAAPRVLYVVPTFKWDPAPSETGDRKHEWRAPQKERADLDRVTAVPPRVGRPDKVLESRRLGNGLRVYLERPWYSSGDEEKLGVILREFPNVPANDPLKPFVTQWGMDPIWSSALPTSFPRATDFKLATAVQAGLSLDELPLPNVTVGAIGHDVEYDPDRKLWFCDIEIDTGDSYFPFVRMGLARFQPNSLPGAHLSRVVLADFAQLTPDRAASVRFESPNSLSVTVSGFCYRKSSLELELPNQGNFASAQVHGNKIRISLEVQRVGSDLGWVPVPNSEVVLTPTDAAGGLTVWKGNMPLTGNMGPVKLRLVIREYETFIGGPVAHIEERVVYADVLEFQNTSLQLKSPD